MSAPTNNLSPASEPALAPATPRAIRVLPPLVASQIAAGEVVDRPASIVKELVENALDAHATRIIIDLEQGGIELVRVTDDGHGIPQDQLALALTPHATSKVSLASDLDAISTMGFRGEALASIASVSRMSIRSRTKDPATDNGGSEILSQGDSITAIRPASGPHGTTVSVRNVFFNTPARRKFLRSIPTEQGRCLDCVREIAIAHPLVGFKVTVDSRIVLDVPPDQSPASRALQILGPELQDQLIEVNFDSGQWLSGTSSTQGSLSLWGLMGLPSIARGSASAQYVALNGRIIRDKTIAHAIKEAYRGLIEPGRYPTGVLLIEIDPSTVDVNVHPAKSEVRFRDSSMVHSAVLRAVREALRANDLTPTISDERPGMLQRPTATTKSLGSGLLPSDIHTPNAFSARNFADAFKDRFAAPQPHQQTLQLPNPTSQPPTHPSAHTNQDLISLTPASGVVAIHNSFLVTQDAQGMVIIDQHALHERVMFQKLLDRVSAPTPTAPYTNLESQRLLTPAVITLDTLQLEAFEAALKSNLLTRIGIDATLLSTSDIGIHAFPTFLFDRNVEIESFITDMLSTLAKTTPAPNSQIPENAFEAVLHQVLDMMACKAAIKAGNQLSELEKAELLAYRQSIERANACPHGRPTSIRITIKELEKLFHRA